MVHTRLDSVVDVLRDQGHFFNDPLLEAESVKGLLKPGVQLQEAGVEPVSPGPAGTILPLGVSLINHLIRCSNRSDQIAERSDMPLAVIDLLLEDDAVEALFGRLGNQLFG